MVKTRPVSLPRDLSFLADGCDEKIKKHVLNLIDKARAEGVWDEPVDMVVDTNDLNFVAYWVGKTQKPILNPRSGFGLREHFEKFKATDFQWNIQGEVMENITMSASGDLMQGKHIETSGDHLYKYVSPLIFGRDLSYANLESTLSKDAPRPMGVEGQGDTPQINITKNQYHTLVKHETHKYDILQISNNHIMDCGFEGADITMDQLRKDHIKYVGAYRNASEVNQTVFTDTKGIKIGWVGHTFSLNGKALPKGKEWMIDVTPFLEVEDPDLTRIEAQIKRAKEDGCDLVAVALHWGIEFELYPHPKQIEFAHRIAEMGADMIIGHHPHIAQPYEIYTPMRDSNVRVPILYSLGNLIPVFSGESTVLSYVANIQISKIKSGDHIRVFVTGMQVTPVAFMEEESEEGTYGVLIPIKDLKNKVWDQETQAYIDTICSQASLIMGDSWR
ncbi:CapA family protein [Fusibacter ferrireducens]|uniref:CapA family protein n=1 Tax=Fusibacter ferrireducens TaxID=2785058 RepID=A0ABR9ZP73_9FIRM|nr:CapA family protein [Fusibacter ferrireducens]MBF4692214.1 CapA family protein [Fusibacter ferrireducens]